MNRTCNVCYKKKDLSKFRKNPRAKDGYLSMCNSCFTERRSLSLKAKPTLREAINAKCKECIFDPLVSGSWKQQIRDCTSPTCPLFEVRPHK